MWDAERYLGPIRFRYLLTAVHRSFHMIVVGFGKHSTGRKLGHDGGEVVMAGVKLDGAGTQKMKTLEDALMVISSLHGTVERMAVEVKANKGVGIIPQQIKRVLVPLQGQLKGQFGLIADQIAGMILASSRGGGGDQARVRVMREHVAQLRTALELAANKVKAQHAVEIESSGD